MRMDVHLDQLHIPTSTKVAAGALVSVLAALMGWNLVETISNGKQQRDDKREVWIEIGRLQATDQVTDVRLRALESERERQQK